MINSEICDILAELGYQLQDRGREYRARPIYRDSGNSTSLCIFKDNGSFVDFSAGISGTFLDLIKLTKGMSSVDEAKKFLEDHKIDIAAQFKSNNKAAPIKTTRIYPPEILLRLLPKYDFFINRGISVETLKTFQVGMAHSGKLRMRIVAPIYDGNQKIVGFWGRWHSENVPESVSKYKIIGPKHLFTYPLHLNRQEILDSKKIIIVEGPSDVLHCWEHGVRNVVCLFGVKMLQSVLKSLIALNPEKIIIATNNEVENNSIGNDAAVQIQKGLLKYFDQKNIIIHLPPKKDLASLSPEELRNWYNQV